MNHERVERLFSLFKYLTFNKNKTVQDLARLFHASQNTIYRHIDMFKCVGFEISTTYGGIYRIVSFPKEFIKVYEMHRQAVSGSINDSNPEPTADDKGNQTTYEVLGEFKENCAYTKVPYLRRYTSNAMKLIQASKEHKQVILHGYESNSRNCACDRKVEPYDFHWYFNYLWAYDLDTKQNLLFKVTQIDDVEILDKEWTEEKRHKRQKVDAFGVSGHFKTPIRIKMTVKAKNRLVDEHPMAIRSIKKIDGGDYWEFADGVCGYEEVARFYMGLCGDVDIVEGCGLHEYVVSFMEEQLDKARAKLSAWQRHSDKQMFNANTTRRSTKPWTINSDTDDAMTSRIKAALNAAQDAIQIA